MDGSPPDRKRNCARITHVLCIISREKMNSERPDCISTHFINIIHNKYEPVRMPVIHTSQTGRSARGPRWLLGRVDRFALFSRVIFPSARSPNITPMRTVVAHALANRRKREARVRGSSCRVTCRVTHAEFERVSQDKTLLHCASAD